MIIGTVGNFSIQYSISVLSIAVAFMTSVSDAVIDGQADLPEPQWAKNALIGTIFAGILTGLFVIGYAADVVGRRAALLLSLSMVVLGSIGCSVCPWGEAGSIYTVIAIFRFVTGFGVGGTYPAAFATVADGHDKDAKGQEEEGAAGAEHGAASQDLAISYLWQMPGSMAPYAVAWALLLMPSSLPNLTSIQFRTLMGVGIVPAAIVLVASWGKKEEGKGEQGEKGQQQLGLEGEHAVHGHSSSLLEHDSLSSGGPPVTAKMLEEGGAVAGAGAGAGAGAMPSQSHLQLQLQQGGDARQQQPQQKHSPLQLLRANPHFLWTLLGTAGSWMVYDFLYYLLALGTPQVLKAVWGSGVALSDVCWQTLVLGSLTIVGTVLTIPFLKRPGLGARWVNIWGFVLMALCFIALGLTFLYNGSNGLKFGLVCFTYFALSWGPSVGVHVLAATLYPRELRSTMFGLSAAGGKVGAVIGTFAFTPLVDSYGLPAVMWTLTCFSLAGIALSIFCLPKGDIPSALLLEPQQGGGLAALAKAAAGAGSGGGGSGYQAMPLQRNGSKGSRSSSRSISSSLLMLASGNAPAGAADVDVKDAGAEGGIALVPQQHGSSEHEQ